MKRRQTVRRLEIIAVLAVVAVSLGVGFYLALNAQGLSHSLDGTPVPSQVVAALYQTSKTPYGASDSTLLKDVKNYTGPLFYTKGEPILVYVGADYCPFCAGQRWPLIIALMRFGNFSNLRYMVSGEDNYASFTFAESSYQSKYVVFQPYEVEDNAGNPLKTLPTNYTTAFQQVGHSAFPFLNFADEYIIPGAILNPTILGTKNQTQIISSIQAEDSLGSQIKQAANLITAVICKITGDKPASVCGQDSITALTVSYAPPSLDAGSELLLAGSSFTTSPDTFIAIRDSGGWN
jgi:hypothetical protein